MHNIAVKSIWIFSYFSSSFTYIYIYSIRYRNNRLIYRIILEHIRVFNYPSSIYHLWMVKDEVPKKKPLSNHMLPSSFACTNVIYRCQWLMHTGYSISQHFTRHGKIAGGYTGEDVNDLIGRSRHRAFVFSKRIEYLLVCFYSNVRWHRCIEIHNHATGRRCLNYFKCLLLAIDMKIVSREIQCRESANLNYMNMGWVGLVLLKYVHMNSRSVIFNKRSRYRVASITNIS